MCRLFSPRPQAFVSDGAAEREAEREPSHAVPAEQANSQQASSTVCYRSHTLVFIKPEKGSFERVFLGQVLEPVVEVRTIVDRPGRHRARALLRFAVENIRVRYFSPRGGDDDSGRYEHDSNSSETVNAAAIYGRVEVYTNDVVSNDGLLLAFDVEQEEIDRMEGVINGGLDQSSSEDSDDEIQTEALQRLRRRVQQEKSLHNKEVLSEGAVRSRAPVMRLTDRWRYNEVRGRSMHG
jgi:hypothetical protein